MHINSVIFVHLVHFEIVRLSKNVFLLLSASFQTFADNHEQSFQQYTAKFIILECMHMNIIIRSTCAHFLRNTFSNFLSPHDYSPFIYVSRTQLTQKSEQHTEIYYPLKNSQVVKKGMALCIMAIV